MPDVDPLYIEVPEKTAEVRFYRVLHRGEAPLATGQPSPCDPDLICEWEGDLALPLLVSLELEAELGGDLSHFLPWPMERLGQVNEHTAIYRRLNEG